MNVAPDSGRKVACGNDVELDLSLSLSLSLSATDCTGGNGLAASPQIERLWECSVGRSVGGAKVYKFYLLRERVFLNSDLNDAKRADKNLRKSVFSQLEENIYSIAQNGDR